MAVMQFNDIRNSTPEDMIKVFESFLSIKPTITWYDERPTLKFKKGNKELHILNVYFMHNSINAIFFTGVDNIVFESRIPLNDKLEKQVTELIEHGISKDILDYI